MMILLFVVRDIKYKVLQLLKPKTMISLKRLVNVKAFLWLGEYTREYTTK